MLFYFTPEDHIRTSEEQRRTETDGGGSSFASEQELQELAGAWSMKRLVEIWNRLPGVERVIRFTDRKTAIARIWRAIQPRAEKGGKPARRGRRITAVLEEDHNSLGNRKLCISEPTRWRSTKPGGR